MLATFTLRRWLFVLAALQPRPRQTVADRTTPSVLLLVPVRNEAKTIVDLCRALDRLVYPAEQLTVVFIDDGSTDTSSTVLADWVRGRRQWHLLSSSHNAGKAQALNTALAQFAQGEIVAIYDADERPEPEALRTLVQPFNDPAVGGVSGRRAVSNPLASPAASYTTFEGLVHQLITMQAKDRLKLAPALLGANCAYRRAALTQVGQFTPGALLEDTDLTLRLHRAGWSTRFVPAALSYHAVPETIQGYWQQHTRWARGFNDVVQAQAGSLLQATDLSLSLRVELLFFALGYLDRLALLAGLGLALLKNRWAARAVILSLLTPLLQVMAALKLAAAPGALWRRLIWLPFFFGLDIAMAATGLLHTLRQTPRRWEERKARG
ncbi:MAG TPA: glycosyltransferase family 2 protein [Anaerolineae bacterium]|nr:glycosyltransferase family 2 protein [Anaerolineae bacterium]